MIFGAREGEDIIEREDFEVPPEDDDDGEESCASENAEVYDGSELQNTAGAASCPVPRLLHRLRASSLGLGEQGSEDEEFAGFCTNPLLTPERSQREVPSVASPQVQRPRYHTISESPASAAQARKRQEENQKIKAEGYDGQPRAAEGDGDDDDDEAGSSSVRMSGDVSLLKSPRLPSAALGRRPEDSGEAVVGGRFGKSFAEAKAGVFGEDSSKSEEYRLKDDDTEWC